MSYNINTIINIQRVIRGHLTRRKIIPCKYIYYYYNKYLQIKSKLDPNTQEPIDDLTSDCIEWLRSIGSESSKVSDIIEHRDELVYKEIENGNHSIRFFIKKS